ncbi:MAG TPA: DUF177 domain-containing protein [Ramlibacter sp.]|nr:DUF177 domain-containing protein [Ramlibacter sp.]
MTKEFSARRLDVKSFAEDAAALAGGDPVAMHPRLMAETQGRGADGLVTWSASGELRNPRHVHPEAWVHLRAQARLPLTCQRCLGPVDVDVAVERSFRFAPDEDIAAAQDEESEEDVLALSRSFDLVELVEDELLMELPLAPRHAVCPDPVKFGVADEDFDEAAGRRENPFALLDKLKRGPK